MKAIRATGKIIDFTGRFSIKVIVFGASPYRFTVCANTLASTDECKQHECGFTSLN